MINWKPPLEKRSDADLESALATCVEIYTRPTSIYAEQAWLHAAEIRAELQKRKEKKLKHPIK